MFAVCNLQKTGALAFLQTLGLALRFAVCKLVPMTPTDLSKSAGISVPYASQILSGERKPSLKLAVKIYDATGQAFGALHGLSSKEIEGARKVAA